MERDPLPLFAAVFDVFPPLDAVLRRPDDLGLDFFVGAGFGLPSAVVSGAPYSSVVASAKSAAVRKIKIPLTKNEGQADRPALIKPSYCPLLGSVPGTNRGDHSAF